MAEATLVITSLGLAPSLRVAGRTLLERMTAKNIPFVAAYWSLDEESETWRLNVATPMTDREGPLHVYHLLQDILRKMPADLKGELELPDIAVISPKSMDVREMRRRYRAVEHEDEHRIRRPDAPYIYLLKPE